jgi:hypothetical protein
MLKWIRSLLAMPKPVGPPRVLLAYSPEKPTVTQDNRADHSDAPEFPQVPGGRSAT